MAATGDRVRLAGRVPEGAEGVELVSGMPRLATADDQLVRPVSRCDRDPWAGGGWEGGRPSARQVERESF